MASTGRPRTRPGPPTMRNWPSSTPVSARREAGWAASLRPRPPGGSVPAALPAPVRAVVDAANAGDADAFVACFPPSGFVDDWGRQFRGHEAIRGWSDQE